MGDSTPAGCGNEQDNLITVIVAARNAALTIPLTLASLERNLADSPPGTVELVFVDGGCTDDTMRLVRSRAASLEARARCRYTTAPAGVANAYNTGVTLAAGKYSMFLNADDEWAAGYLAAMAAAIRSAERRHPRSLIVVHSSIAFIDLEGRELYRRRPPYYFSAVQKRQSVILHPNAAYPTELLKRHPFPVYADLRPSDQEQVHALMKEAKAVRLAGACYRYRISALSGTVRRAGASAAEFPAWPERLLRLVCRLYVQCFESRLPARLLMRLRGTTYWRVPAR